MKPSAYDQHSINGSDVLGARGSVLSLSMGAGAARSHSGPLEHPNRSVSRDSTSQGVVDQASDQGDGEHLSPPAPIDRLEPKATAHSGSGAAPQDAVPPLLTGGQKTVRGRQVGAEGPEVVEGVRLSVDWLSITFHPSKALVNVLEARLAASLALDCDFNDWVELERGSYGYQKGMVGPGGARLWWDAPGRDDFHISFPGQACGVVGQERLVSFLQYSLGHGGKATRCDVALDDYQRIVSPGQVRESLQGPDVVTHAQKVLTQQGGVVGSRDLTGATVYLGAPGSRQRLRVYDKGLESEGEMDCIRWELESRKEAAETMVVALAYQDWSEVMASRLVGFVDFRDADSYSDVEGRTRLPWFQLLVGLAEKASAYLPKVARTVEEVVDWLDRAIGPSLAVAMKFWQGDLAPLLGILRNGENRWKPKHRAMLAVAAVVG